MRECIEEGILQAYVDDELSSEMAEEVASHIAACTACAGAATEIALETSVFASAFESENALAIPTVRLRERIDAAIAGIERPAGVTRKTRDTGLSGWLGAFSGLFRGSPQRALGFATLIAVVAFAAIFAAIRWNQSADTNSSSPVVADKGKRPETARPVKSSASPTPGPQDGSNGGSNKNGGAAPNNRVRPKKQPKPNLVPAPGQLPRDELVRLKPLPGEQNYLKAIDSLTLEIEASDVSAMRPSLRSEYERNLAIVDQAIDSTRRVARRNPKDPDASAFLYSSYQSKVDLLNAVAEQVRPTIATR